MRMALWDTKARPIHGGFVRGIV